MDSIASHNIRYVDYKDICDKNIPIVDQPYLGDDISNDINLKSSEDYNGNYKKLEAIESLLANKETTKNIFDVIKYIKDTFDMKNSCIACSSLLRFISQFYNDPIGLSSGVLVSLDPNDHLNIFHVRTVVNGLSIDFNDKTKNMIMVIYPTAKKAYERGVSVITKEQLEAWIISYNFDHCKSYIAQVDEYVECIKMISDFILL